MDLRGNIPTFIRITHGKAHDVNILDEIVPEVGAFYVMDCGYMISDGDCPNSLAHTKIGERAEAIVAGVNGESIDTGGLHLVREIAVNGRLEIALGAQSIASDGNLVSLA